MEPIDNPEALPELMLSCSGPFWPEASGSSVSELDVVDKVDFDGCLFSETFGVSLKVSPNSLRTRSGASLSRALAVSVFS